MLLGDSASVLLAFAVVNVDTFVTSLLRLDSFRASPAFWLV